MMFKIVDNAIVQKTLEWTCINVASNAIVPYYAGETNHLRHGPGSARF